MANQRFLLWQIDETAGFDSAWATIRGTRLVAEGRTGGQRPMPFWVEYRLETGDAFVTARASAGRTTATSGRAH